MTEPITLPCAGLCGNRQPDLPVLHSAPATDLMSGGGRAALRLSLQPAP